MVAAALVSLSNRFVLLVTRLELVITGLEESRDFREQNMKMPPSTHIIGWKVTLT